MAVLEELLLLLFFQDLDSHKKSPKSLPARQVDEFVDFLEHLGRILLRVKSLLDDVVSSFDEKLGLSVDRVFNDNTHSLSVTRELHLPDNFKLVVLSKPCALLKSQVDKVFIARDALKVLALRKLHENHFIRTWSVVPKLSILELINFTRLGDGQNLHKLLYHLLLSLKS
jgi:hypothetical protein